MEMGIFFLVSLFRQDLRFAGVFMFAHFSLSMFVSFSLSFSPAAKSLKFPISSLPFLEGQAADVSLGFKLFISSGFGSFLTITIGIFTDFLIGDGSSVTLVLLLFLIE